VAEADYDCRPPGVRPTASEPKANRFSAASAILHSSPDPSSLALAALPDDAVLAFNVRAFSPDGDCATRSHRRRVPHERKKCSAASLHLVSICTSRSGTYVEQLDYFGWRQSRFRRPSWVMNAFAQSATLSSTRSACDRGAGVLPDGLILSSIVVGIGLFTGWKRAPKWSFATPRCCFVEPRAQGQPVSS
jgi:hypothetical protein